MASTKRALESDSDSGTTSGIEYEVERILAQTIDMDGDMKYQVKWKGYDDHESTWEGPDSFSNPTTLIQWEERYAKGDFLPEHEVNRVQKLMDRFQDEQVKLQRQQEEARQSREVKRRKLVAVLVHQPSLQSERHAGVCSAADCTSRQDLSAAAKSCLTLQPRDRDIFDKHSSKENNCSVRRDCDIFDKHRSKENSCSGRRDREHFFQTPTKFIWHRQVPGICST